MATSSKNPTKVFRGLNNVGDPLRLGLEWQTQADNVVITGQNVMERCKGYVRRTTNVAVSGGYVTEDLQRLYLVDDGELRMMNDDLSYTVLATGLSSDPTYFTEVNGLVYYANGTDYGVIDGTVARPWGIVPPSLPNVWAGSGPLPGGVYSVCCTLTSPEGIESGNGDVASILVPDDSSIGISGIEQREGYTTNVYVTMRDGTVYFQLAANAGDSITYNVGPDSLGMELPFWLLDPPRGTIPAYYAGQIYVAEYMPADDYTVIWRSEPLHFHHFDLGSEAIAVPGKVLIMQGLQEALIIGTERAIHFYNGEATGILAPYGVVPGVHGAKYNGHLYMWTLRGACRMLPFENLTEDTISVAPGTSAAGIVVEQEGQRRYVTALHKGGVPFNRRDS